MVLLLLLLLLDWSGIHSIVHAAVHVVINCVIIRMTNTDNLVVVTVAIVKLGTNTVSLWGMRTILVVVIVVVVVLLFFTSVFEGVCLCVWYRRWIRIDYEWISTATN